MFLAPDRLSFVNTVRILRSAVFEPQSVAPSQQAAWRERLLRDIARKPLPERDNRCNPRVVKRKLPNFEARETPSLAPADQVLRRGGGRPYLKSIGPNWTILIRYKSWKTGFTAPLI